MTGFEDVVAETLAKLFFHYREALAPDFDCKQEGDGGDTTWEAAPSNQRKLLIAAARLVLLDLANTTRIQTSEASGERRLEGSEGKECGC